VAAGDGRTAGMPPKQKTAQSDAGGRDLPSVNRQAFLKECYHREDLTRLQSHLKNAKYREQQRTGEFKMISVMRDHILGAVPRPGGYYRRVCVATIVDQSKRS